MGYCGYYHDKITLKDESWKCLLVLVFRARSLQGYEGFHKALGITFRNLAIFAILIYRFSPILFYSPLINVREDLMSKAGNVSMHVDSLTNIF